ncbi:MAG: FKBP-type peptidyl-prolyl cis-trans isomerase [Burkholderiaceae bacterium]|jgi:FKBP-type peptidyl-prolyl cis-trans isomerase SlyD
MKITEQCVVGLSWTLKDTLGEILDETPEPIEFLVGSDDLLPKLQDALMGKTVGARVELQIEPEDAFGDYNETLVFLESRTLFPENIEEGMVFEGLPAGCNTEAPKNQLFFVSDIYPEHVVLDGNHPLAGIAIRIHAKIESIREATVSEVGAGTLGTGFLKLAEPPAATPHVHGPDSNHLH